MDWRHDELANDLAAHLRCGGRVRTWVNIALGRPSDPRPDVYTLTPFSFASPGMISYEVKVSVADFRSDITSGKWQKYLAFSQGVTFAVPQGLITVADVPKGCGLIVRGDRMWRHVRKPTLQQVQLPVASMLKLLSSPPQRTLADPRVADSTDPEWNYMQRQRREIEEQITAAALRKIGRRLGRDIAEYLRAPQSAEKIIADARQSADDYRKRQKEHAETDRQAARQLWDEIGALFGLPPGTESHVVQQQWWRARKRIKEDAEIAKLHDLLKRMRGVIDEALLEDRPAGADQPESHNDLGGSWEDTGIGSFDRGKSGSRRAAS